MYNKNHSYIFFVVASAGCSTFQKWEAFNVSEPYPWVAKGMRVAAFTKSSPCFYRPTGERSRPKWVGQNDQNLDNHVALEDTVKEFLSKTTIAKTWPKSSRSSYKVDEFSIAPYEFYAVSIYRIVVLMVYDEVATTSGI